MKYQLGKIEKIDLRSVWKHEAHDFTKWLAQPENLAELGNAIDMELELIEAESNVGGFHVDIFAIESGTSNKVVIENQLEETNHDHLGKTITYAAGKDAKAIAWIVARARDEHRQAIEWLIVGTGFMTEMKASVSDMFGTASSSMESKMDEASKSALEKVVKQAMFAGGNAVLGVSYNVYVLDGNMLGVTASGTSVVIEPLS